jgi:hypothetical protein
VFRASSCPSSGATTTAVAASGLPSERGDSRAVEKMLEILINNDSCFCNKSRRLLKFVISQITHLRNSVIYSTKASFSGEVRYSCHCVHVLVQCVCGSCRCEINKGDPLWRRTYLWCIPKRFAAAFHWPSQIKKNEFAMSCTIPAFV